MMMTPTVLRAAFRGLALGAAVLLGACNGVGEGIAPVSAVLLPAGGSEGDNSFKGYSCLPTSIVFIVEFSNGARGDFSSRAKWSSSKPEIAKVSNGDLAVPEPAGQVYGEGVVIPVAPGTATITARYLDFSQSISITVTDPSNFKITPDTADLAVGSLFDLAASVDLDGKTTPIDGSTTWAFETAADTVATIAATTGLISGKAESTPGQLVAKARVPGCTFSDTAAVNVSPLDALTISKEFASDKLVVGTTERITATGTLKNAATQDLSAQVSYTATDTTSPAPATPSISFLFGSLGNLVLANAASEAHTSIQASFGADAAKKTSNTLEVTPIQATLNTVEVTPETANLEPGATVQLKAAGKFQVGTAAEFSQDISRHVSWSSSDAANFLIQSSGTAINQIAGLLLAGSAAPVGTMTTITATSSSATGGKTDSALVTVVADSP